MYCSQLLSLIWNVLWFKCTASGESYDECLQQMAMNMAMQSSARQETRSCSDKSSQRIAPLANSNVASVVAPTQTATYAVMASSTDMYSTRVSKVAVEGYAGYGNLMTTAHTSAVAMPAYAWTSRVAVEAPPVHTAHDTAYMNHLSEGYGSRVAQPAHMRVVPMYCRA